jgi:hypothetical protein
MFSPIRDMPDVPEQLVHASPNRLHLGERMLGSCRQASIVIVDRLILSEEPQGDEKRHGAETTAPLM